MEVVTLEYLLQESKDMKMVVCLTSYGKFSSIVFINVFEERINYFHSIW
jgi:hypothetical protein